jgi:hypothetical protein
MQRDFTTFFVYDKQLSSHFTFLSLRYEEVIMRLWLLLGLVLSFLVVLVIPAQASGQKIHGFSFGYGFGFLSTGKTIGQIEEGHYDFVQFTYQYENPLSEVLGLVIEPFASYTIDPKEGVDAGITLSLKYNFHKKNQNGFFQTWVVEGHTQA